MADPKAAEHIAALLVHLARQQTSGTITLFRDEISETLRDSYGFDCPEQLIDDALTTLRTANAVTRLDSPLTGDMFDIYTSALGYYFEEGASGDTEDFDFWGDRNRKIAALPVIHTYYKAGQKWVNRVVDSLKSRGFDDSFWGWGTVGNEATSAVAVPASDRVVTIDHNQQVELDEAATTLIAEIEKENGIDGDANLRNKVLGQLKAGRELIRSTVFSGYLLYQTLMSMLGSLMEKYKGHVIGEAAKVLFALLLQHVFTG